MKYVLGMIIGLLIIAASWFVFFGNAAIVPEESISPVASEEGAEGRFAIATSFYALQFALERIVGDQAVVTNIGAGRDPHDFQPSTQDVLQLQRADLAVFQGAGFEPWGESMVDRLRADGVPVFIATDGVELHEGGHAHEEEVHEEEEGEDHSAAEQHETEEEHEEGDEHGAYDPHTWLDPVLMSDIVTRLVAELVALDGENAAVYEANAAALQTELAALDAEYRTRLMQCELSEVITSHDAFGYVADRYGFSIHTIAGLSTQDTPSAVTLAELRAEAEEGVGAILLEANSVTAYGETLARETGLGTLSINPIAYMIPAGEDYLSLMRSNLDAFASALNCNG